MIALKYYLPFLSLTITITIFSNLIGASTALFFTNYCVDLKLDSWLLLDS